MADQRSNPGSDDLREPGSRPPGTLAERIEAAIRLGDAREDAEAALFVLARALVRFPDAPAVDRARALLYRAELAARTDDRVQARRSLLEAEALRLGAGDESAIAEEFEDTRAIVASLG